MSTKEEDYKRKFALTVEWLWKYKKGKSIKSFFEENKYQHVMVYGIGLLGELLLDEIAEYVTICFDQKRGNICGKNIISLDDINELSIDLNDNELVIITLMDLDKKIESNFYHLGFQGDILNIYDIVKFYS